MRSSTSDNEGQSRKSSRPSPRFLNFLSQFRTFEALRHHEFRLLSYGQIFVSMGAWMDEVSRGWLIYELTSSAVQLGLVRGVQAIPLLLLSPIAGSAADRYNRRTQLVVAQTVDALVYAILAVLIFSGRIRPWHVYVSAFSMAIVQTFQQPARASLISDTVPAGCITNAIGISATIFNVARSTGPALAGILIALSGTGGAYAAQAAFYIVATVLTLRMPKIQSYGKVAGGRPGERESFGRSILNGWKFSMGNEAVRTGLIVVMVASFFLVPFTTLLPVFARDLLGIGATGQGLLLTAMGVGALCSAVLIATAGDKLPRGMLMLASVALYGFVLVIFAASRWFSLSLVIMVVIGLCHVHSNALVQTVIQSYSPPEFRGRTMSLFFMSRVVIIAGSMIIGALSSMLGARWAVASLSTAGVLAMLAIFMAMPRARLIR